MEDGLEGKKIGKLPLKKIEEDLKKNIRKMEDDLKHNFKKSTLIGCDIIVN
jgi:hypothetical protein